MFFWLSIIIIIAFVLNDCGNSNSCRIQCGKVKHELRVQMYELRVQIYKLRVQICELRVQIYELRVQIHEFEE